MFVERSQGGKKMWRSVRGSSWYGSWIWRGHGADRRQRESKASHSGEERGKVRGWKEFVLWFRLGLMRWIAKEVPQLLFYIMPFHIKHTQSTCITESNCEEVYQDVPFHCFASPKPDTRLLVYFPLNSHVDFTILFLFCHLLPLLVELVQEIVVPKQCNAGEWDFYRN